MASANNTYIMKHIILAATVAAALGLASCSEDRFHVEGSISSAEDSLLYFEQMTLDGPVTIDSLRLGSDGEFGFSDKRPDAPEFYRLRIGRQIINIAADSTETITVRADYPTMATGYGVEGSAECARIKELALMQIDLQQRVLGVVRSASLSRAEAADSVEAMLRQYKGRVTRDYIYKDPKAASSYFALFQAIGNRLIFDPEGSPDDIKAYAAVATAWETFHPGALRGESLHNIAIRGMRNERIASAEAADTIDPAKISTAGLIDIRLADNRGRTRSLSELKGSVVLLDFHLFGLKDSPQRILSLRELYNKYHASGFEIYQVAIDPDEHFWKQQTAALPWICVRDPAGANSQTLSIYNVASVPEFFLIDRGNNIVSRSTQIDDLDKAIAALL